MTRFFETPHKTRVSYNENHIPNFGWKSVLALVGNSCTYKLGMDHWLVMGGSTILMVL